MKITIVDTDTVYNRATRQKETREWPIGSFRVSNEVSRMLRKMSEEYRCTVADVVSLALCYYFGDGKNHLQCEYCDYWSNGCQMPEPGKQTTLPLLDKGSVVVGLPTDDQGKRKGGENA